MTARPRKVLPSTKFLAGLVAALLSSPALAEDTTFTQHLTEQLACR